MEEVLQRFTAWFIKFAVISAVILLSTHLIARSIRSKKKQTNSVDKKTNSTEDNVEETSDEETS